MNYKAGDTVLCIDAKVLWLPTGNLKAGNSYVVHYTDGKACTSVEGVMNPEGYGWCHQCGEYNNGLAHFLPSRFIKLDPLVADDQSDTVVRTGLPRKAKEALGIE